MRNDSYLILGNAKKANLIFSVFRPFDLMLFAVGAATTILLFVTIPTDTILLSFLIALPILISGVLVFPLPNYHNTLVFITKGWEYLNKNKRYHWRGWCYNYGETNRRK